MKGYLLYATQTTKHHVIFRLMHNMYMPLSTTAQTAKSRGFEVAWPVLSCTVTKIISSVYVQ